jgi:CheY-like chemotaxis protein
MSHELRTPMNAILGFADLLSTGDPSPLQREEYLSIISRSGKHLLALINDILDMSKIESGRMELELGPVLIREITQEVIDLLGDRAAQKGLTLRLVIKDDVPEAIVTDEVKLRQILLNLTSNAIKATTEGAVDLTVEAASYPTSGAGMLRIAVADTGIGIAPEDVDRIFEPFQQVGPSLGGTGLGLSISRRFATLMGGDLTVHSVVGEGAEFQVMVPAPEADVVPDRGQGAHRMVVGLEPGQDVRVLIAEDHKDSALLLSTLMEQAGIDVHVADNGELAVEAFGSFQPQLIWMDARMPVMDGLEAARLIRQQPGGADVVIIGVTASVFVDERTTLIDAGMDAVITKPFRAFEIYDCMTERLGTRFVFQEGSGEAGTPVGEASVTSEQLAVLPHEVRAALEDALLLLDSALISTAVERAASSDPGLGEALRSLTEALRYEAILRALDDVPDEDT